MSLFFRPQPGSAYMPINVDGSPGRSFRGGPAPIQVTAPPQGLGRSGSPANGPGSSIPVSAASLIRTPYSNYAVASAVAQANHKGIAPPQGTGVDPVRYYQGVAAAAAANNLPAVANIGQNYSTSRVDPSATVFVRNAVRIDALISRYLHSHKSHSCIFCLYNRHLFILPWCMLIDQSISIN